MIQRRYNASTAFYQYVWSHFFAGQRFVFVTALRPHSAGGFDPDMLRGVRVIEDDRRSFRTLGLALGPGRGSGHGRPQIGPDRWADQPARTAMFDWQTGACSYGDLNTDADFCFVADRGEELEFGFVNACRVVYGEQTLFDMPLNTVMYQGPVDYRVPLIRTSCPDTITPWTKR